MGEALVAATVESVATWLGRLGAPVVPGTVAIVAVQHGPAGHPDPRAEFDVRARDEHLLTLSEVAALLGLPHRSVVRMIDAGFLAGYSFFAGHDERHAAACPMRDRRKRAGPTPGATRWRIHPADFADFLREHPEQYDRARIRHPTWRAIADAAARRTRLLRVPEVARCLGCAEERVRGLLRRGDLQGVLLRDRAAISWYVFPASVADLPAEVRGSAGRPAQAHGRRGYSEATRERRARILAARPALQARFDAAAADLVAGRGDRRRKAGPSRQPADSECASRSERTIRQRRACAAGARHGVDDSARDDARDAGIHRTVESGGGEGDSRGKGAAEAREGDRRLAA